MELLQTWQPRNCYAIWRLGGLFAVALWLAAIVNPKPVAAFEVGNWRSVCLAANWQTGEVEPVAEVSVSHYPIRHWFARTHRLIDGSWRMEFNINFIRASRLSEEARKYVFYHECAHARKNDANEHNTDCEALSHMRAEGNVTRKAMRDIGFAYLKIMRRFPTGGPCNIELRNLEQTTALRD